MADWAAFKGYNNNKAVVLSVVDLNNLRPFGVHFYPTQAQAEAKPNSVIGFPNPAAVAMIPLVNAAIDDYNNSRNISPTVAKDPTNPGAAVTATKNGAEAAAKATLGNITGGITGFSGTNFVLRALKIIVGGVLVIVGIAHLTGADNAITKVVSKVPLIPV